MSTNEQHPSQDAIAPTNPTDYMILELLGKARAKREIAISDAARMARQRDDMLEVDASLIGIVSQEAIALHRVMLRRNSRLHRMNFFSNSSIKLERGRISHTPRSITWRNHYPVSTPILFATEHEFVGEAQISDGYIFRTYHPQYGGDESNPTISIDRVFKDSLTGESIIKNDYVVHTYDGDTDHPHGYVTGNAIAGEWPANVVRDPNDDRILPVVGLLRMARFAIKQ